MVCVIADGDGRHHLEDSSGAEVGWIRGGAIGFRGLRNETQAIAAAAAGWPPLQALLKREYAGWPRKDVTWDRLRLVHDGAYEWVSDGRVPLARLYRPPAPLSDVASDVASAPERPAGLAIEFVLPSYASEGTAISIAQVLCAALASHLGGGAARVTASRGGVPGAAASLRLPAPPGLPLAASA